MKVKPLQNLTSSPVFGHQKGFWGRLYCGTFNQLFWSCVEALVDDYCQTSSGFEENDWPSKDQTFIFWDGEMVKGSIFRLPCVTCDCLVLSRLSIPRVSTDNGFPIESGNFLAFDYYFYQS